MEISNLKSKEIKRGIKELVEVRFTLSQLNIVYVVRVVSDHATTEYVFSTRNDANLYYDLF